MLSGAAVAFMRPRTIPPLVTDALATNPINPDRQCGVINDKNLPCSRSLTCKTHTVGAKRAVPGRTRPYDILFIEWQQEHNPNYKPPLTKRNPKSAKRRKHLVENMDDEAEDGEMEALIGFARDCGEGLEKVFGLRYERVVAAATAGVRVGVGGGTGSGARGWRSGDMAIVGELLTKALATRPQQQVGLFSDATHLGSRSWTDRHAGVGTAFGRGAGFDHHPADIGDVREGSPL